MEESRKIELLENMLEMETGSLKPEMLLSEIEEWDSLSVLSLIVLISDNFGKTINHEDTKKLSTVRDILDSMCE